MNILIIGGCGQQAQPAIEMLLDGNDFEQVIIGDINIEAADKLVEQYSHPKLKAIKVDALDHPSLVESMMQADIIYNCSGPYHLLGVKVLTAAIEAGKHYVDYCDDVEPTIEMLALTEQAQAKGISAIVGLGASPGFSNLLAMQGAKQFDQVDEVNMYWSIANGEPEGPAVLDHMFHIMSGEVTQHIEGKQTLVPALSGMEQNIDMPAPYGTLPCAFVGHPEPVTLPKYIPGVKQVINKYAASMDELGFFAGLQSIGLFDNKEVSIKGQTVSPRNLLIHQFMSLPQQDIAEQNRESVLMLDVTGSKGGETSTLRFSATANMAPLTSIPGVLGALMLARGEINETGVMPPEACIEPDSFIERLVELGLIKINKQAIPSLSVAV